MGTLRTLLAVSVLITHSDTLFGVRLLAGDMAITCFYIVSGFLMTLILTEKYAANTKAYFVNRLLRIYVPYAAALVFAIVVFAMLAQPAYDPFAVYDKARLAGNTWWIVWATISNVSLIGMDLTRYIEVTTDWSSILFPTFLHAGSGGGHNMLFVPQAWTLAIELQFYLLAPFLMRRLNAFWLLILTAAMFVITHGLYMNLREANVPIDPSAIFAMQLPYFLLGGLAYHGYRYLRDWSAPHTIKRGMAYPVWILALVMLYFAFPILRREELSSYYYFYVAFAVTLPFAFYLSRTWRWDRRVGDYSYPIYLFHFTVGIAVHAWGAQGQWRGELTLLLTIAICVVFLYLIDRPLQGLRRRIAARAGVKDPVTLAEAPSNADSIRITDSRRHLR